MDSADDRNKDSNPDPSKPENPFVKFRQFADLQISSLLQGVLGIPSAFSKSNNSPRWDVFDEDLRRRDELIAKQQALKDSEAQKQGEQSEEHKTQPAKTSQGWDPSRQAVKGQSGPYRRLGHGYPDLPLYSPVSKSLFQTGAGGESNWGPTFSTVHVPYYLEPSQVSDDVMGMIRSMTYNNLAQSTRLHSQISLLPYLLYSPYSPLWLHNEQVKSGTPTALLNYHGAFADLLATTYEKPRGTTFRTKLSQNISNLPLMSAAECMQRIDWFAGNGLLEDPATEVPETSKNVTLKDNNKDASTEQDMYATFLRMAEHPASAVTTFESLFKEVEKVVEKGVGPKEATMLREQREAFVKEHGDSIRELELMLSGLMAPFRQESKEENDGPEDPDRVVATKTTTEHSTDEDGTVETSVTVEKVFADGRVTTTHTSHIEDSTYQGSSDDKETVEGDPDEAKRSVKRGWFWN